MINLLSSFLSILQSIGSILIALLVFMFMITVHEFGHFVAGRILKFQINEFAVGMGPKLLSKKGKDGTTYSLRVLPFGGFCAFEGENEEGEENNPRAFNNQKPWKRIIVLISGALFNFISAILICAIVFLCYGETAVKVNDVYDYAPTINQQLEGKVLYKINGKKLYVVDGLSQYLDETMTIEVIDENGNVQTIDGVTLGNYVTPTVKLVGKELLSDDGQHAITKGDTLYSVTFADGTTKYFSSAGDYDNTMKGISGSFVITVIDNTGVRRNYTITNNQQLEQYFTVEEQQYTGVGMSISYVKHKFAFGEAISRVVPYCGETALVILRTLGNLLTGTIGIEAVGGPISTIGMTSQVVSTGLPNILFLIVLISVNLAVFNLLPVPALDGCQIIFCIIEWIAGKPIDRKVQGIINGIGLIVLLGFAVLVDLLKL